MRIVIFALCVVFLTSGAQSAQLPSGGARIVRVDDGFASRCINGSTDIISFHLLGMITTKRSEREFLWLKEHTAVGLLINTTLEGATGSNTGKVSFPRAFLANIQGYPNNLLWIPTEQNLLSRFALTNGDNIYSTAEFAFTLASMEEDTPAKRVLVELAKITAELPLPPNPFQQGFQFFARYGSRMIESFYDENQEARSIPEGKLLLEFAPNEACVDRFERTGTKLVVKQWNAIDEEGGFIDIGRINDYCWSTTTVPTFEVRYMKKNGDCARDSRAWITLRNPHYSFLLSAYPRVALNVNSLSIYTSPIAPADIQPMSEQAVQFAAMVGAVTDPPAQFLGDTSIVASAHSFANDSGILAMQRPFAGASFAYPVGSGDSYNVSEGTAFEQGQEVVVEGAQSKKAAFDLATTLQRCALYNISPEDCL